MKKVYFTSVSESQQQGDTKKNSILFQSWINNFFSKRKTENHDLSKLHVNN